MFPTVNFLDSNDNFIHPEQASGLVSYPFAFLANSRILNMLWNTLDMKMPYKDRRHVLLKSENNCLSVFIKCTI